MYANDMASAFDIESALAGVELPIHETPFYLLASVLLRRAQLSVEQLNDNWKPKTMTPNTGIDPAKHRHCPLSRSESDARDKSR